MQFVGRDAELDLLYASFNTQQTTHAFQTLTLVGERGIGKSRLVQEFYNRITKDEAWDPTWCNYWPDAFQTPETQMRVVPDMTGHKPAGPPRFLWFGLHWHNPEMHNAVDTSNLKELIDQLEIHAKIMRSQKEVWHQYMDMLIQNGPHSLTRAVIEQVAESLLSNVLPGANLIIELVTVIQQAITNSRHALTYDKLLELQYSEFSERLLAIFRNLCAGPRGIPIILWLDNAQWIDDTSSKFFHILHTTAVATKWPLYILATSRPHAWETMPRDHFLKHYNAQEHAVPPPTDAEVHTCFLREFPGLTQENLALITHKSAGNYLNVVNNINTLRRELKYFEQKAFDNALSITGIRVINEKW